ncbi:hypothetical protein LC612_43630, partial [Nostoc sp. CHAB 5834]|nr:hypothetical protein [Nostoc sp. CHAB 5834]
TATLDPAHGNVANSFRLSRDKDKVVTEMKMTKPVRLRSGIWAASESVHRVYDKSGEVNTETKLNLIREVPLDAAQSFAPVIRQGYVISFIVNGQEVVFRKTTAKPISLPELEELSKKKAPQDTHLAKAIAKKEAEEIRESRLNQAVRIGSGLIAVLIACLLFLLVRSLIKSRSES